MPKTTLESITPTLSRPKPHGRYVAALCPFHDDRHRSLLVFADGFVCLASGCRERGPLEKLSRALGKKPPKPVRLRSSDAPIFPWRTFSNNLSDLCFRASEMLESRPDKRLYLERRGVAEEIDKLQLGWIGIGDVGWYVVPIFSDSGSVVGAAVRADELAEKAGAERYSVSPPPRLYVPSWRLFSRATNVFVTFGIFDAITLSALRLPACSPTNGVRAPVEWFKDGRHYVFVPDAIEWREAQAIADRLGWRASVCRINYPAGLKDPNDFLIRKRTDELIRRLHSAS